nr:uncharacterized protein LOC129257734 isoform X2 [Lytechinus pictus]
MDRPSSFSGSIHWTVCSAETRIRRQRREWQRKGTERLRGVIPGQGKKRKRLQQSKKKGCPAKVVMKEVILFPQFKSSSMSKYVQDRKSRAIREALTNESRSKLNTGYTSSSRLLHLTRIPTVKDQEMTGTSPLAQSWSRRMWSVVQRAASSFTWEGEKKLIYLPFMVNGAQVGIIPPKMVETLASQQDIFELKNNEVHLSSTLSTYAERTARVGEFLSTCRKSVDFITLQGWRNENYAVSRSYYDTPLFEMERSATCLFGIEQYGVHINGYCRHPTEGICMWIGKRSPNKQTYPGKLDQIAAGGLPACLDIRECMMKESEEEASIPRDISSKALPVGAISYFFEDERGLFPETQFVFDLELPVDFQPKVKDGEVSEFYLWPLSKVKEEIATDRFKPNCSLVCLDFLIRHGYINPDDEPHYLDFLSSLHQTHF